MFFVCLFYFFFVILKVMKQPWPGMARTIYGDHERFERVYFSKFHGYYTTGDGEFAALTVYCTLIIIYLRCEGLYSSVLFSGGRKGTLQCFGCFLNSL